MSSVLGVPCLGVIGPFAKLVWEPFLQGILGVGVGASCE